VSLHGAGVDARRRIAGCLGQQLDLAEAVALGSASNEDSVIRASRDLRVVEGAVEGGSGIHPREEMSRLAPALVLPLRDVDLPRPAQVAGAGAEVDAPTVGRDARLLREMLLVDQDDELRRRPALLLPAADEGALAASREVDLAGVGGEGDGVLVLQRVQDAGSKDLRLVAGRLLAEVGALELRVLARRPAIGELLLEHDGLDEPGAVGQHPDELGLIRPDLQGTPPGPLRRRQVARVQMMQSELPPVAVVGAEGLLEGRQQGEGRLGSALPAQLPGQRDAELVAVDGVGAGAVGEHRLQAGDRRLEALGFEGRQEARVHRYQPIIRPGLDGRGQQEQESDRGDRCGHRSSTAVRVHRARRGAQGEADSSVAAASLARHSAASVSWPPAGSAACQSS